MSKGQLAIIGWDGATFDIINPLVAQGRMPNLARLQQEGSWGPCRSTIPPLTPCAWTSISTGVNPGQHGIFDAYHYNPAKRENFFVNSTLRRRPPLWSILSKLGFKTGVFNVPMTYPADQVNGFMIPGMFTPHGLQGFMHPPELQTELEGRFGPYQLECAMDAQDPQRYLELLKEMNRRRLEHALYLLERDDPDFFFLVFISSDRIQHFAFKYLDPSHPQHQQHREAINQVYEDLDQALGRLLAALRPGGHVMMVSDHGAGPVNRSLVLANWLRQKGYLHLLDNAGMAEGSLARLGSLAERVKIKALSVMGSPAAHRLRTQMHDKGINRFLRRLDWDKTKAFSEGAVGSVYLNRAAVRPEEEAALLEKLRRELYQIRDEQGRRVVEEVYLKAEVFSGPAMEQAPDLLVLCSPGWLIKQPSEFDFYGEKLSEELFTTQRWSGRHEMNGIFLLAGPQVRGGQVLTDCQVIDLAPTALHLLGQEIPDYMDGRLLTQALEQGFLEANPPRYTAVLAQTAGSTAQLTPEEEAQVAERLRDLGYIE